MINKRFVVHGPCFQERIPVHVELDGPSPRIQLLDKRAVRVPPGARQRKRWLDVVRIMRAQHLHIIHAQLVREAWRHAITP